MTNDNIDNVSEDKITYEELTELPQKDYSKVTNMDVLYNVPVVLKAKLGQTMLSVEQILKLDIDCIIQLNTNVGDDVELYANDILIGYGEIVVVNEDIGVKITKINIEDVLGNLS